ncbi:MAG TPA: MGMT family protein [Bryobacteraceae bacterium]|nr:MGMT family protein [Bryobacteraceae bacterium]
MKSRIPWREKLDRPQQIVTIPPRMQKRFGRGKMLIPCPLDVDALIRKVPRGKLVTQTQLREKLAQAAGVDVACPITTGIFVRIVAEAAAEDARSGKSRITPYWRVVRDDGSLMEKLPGGPSAQADHLEAEGHRIDREGKLRVKPK